MPPRPFPYPLGIGCDICKINRVYGIIHKKKQRLRNFLNKYLTPREIKYFNAKYVGPHMFSSRSNIILMSNFLAGRWAAKEAVIKAVKPRRVLATDIEVWADASRERYAIVLEPSDTKKMSAEEVLISLDEDEEKEPNPGGFKPTPFDEAKNVPSHDQINGQIVKLSITHDDNFAYAFAMAVSQPEVGDVGGEAEARRVSLEDFEKDDSEKE